MFRELLGICAVENSWGKWSFVKLESFTQSCQGLHLKKTSYTTVSLNICIYFLSCVLCLCCQHIFEYYSLVFQDKKSDFAAPQKAPQLSFACHSGMYCMWGSTSINASDVPKVWAFESAWCKDISSWRPSFHRVKTWNVTFPWLFLCYWRAA